MVGHEVNALNFQILEKTNIPSREFTVREL